MDLTTRFEPIDSAAALEPRWRALETRAGKDTSFFLRWTWMGSWLAVLEAARIELPQLFAVRRGDEDVALALIGRGHASRRLGPVSALWLNQSGDPEGDRPFIEYNGLLCRAEHRLPAAHAFCEGVAARRDWHVLHVSGIGFASPLPDVPGVRRTVLRDAAPAYYVDLSAVRAAEGDYLALLSSNCRNQIRRSLRDEPGPVAVAAVPDACAADHWLDDMQCLNGGRHKDNAWGSRLFRDFVRHIVAAGLKDGSVELLRMTSGDDTIGYLLNFLWAGRAMNYQSAFAQPRTAKSKPGLMCHMAAVERYARAGYDRYSLLAGKDRYKQSLSTGAEELHWWTLERFDVRLEVEAAARKLLKL